MSWIYVDRTKNDRPRWTAWADRAAAQDDPYEAARMLRRVNAIRCAATNGAGDRCGLDDRHEGRRHEP